VVLGNCDWNTDYLSPKNENSGPALVNFSEARRAGLEHGPSILARLYFNNQVRAQPQPEIFITKAVMSGLAGLDRKQMEAERLARASLKRPAPADDTTNQHEDSHRKRVKIGHPLERIDEAHVVIRNNHKNEDAKHVAADVVKASVEQSTNDDNSVESASQVKPAQLPKAQSSSSNNASISTSSSSVLQYPAGTLKRTWAYGHPRASDIKIEEVLQKNTLNTAIISSWQWDFDWLMTKFVPGKTKFVFAMEVKDDAEVSPRCALRLVLCLTLYPPL